MTESTYSCWVFDNPGKWYLWKFAAYDCVVKHDNDVGRCLVWFLYAECARYKHND